MTIRYYRIDVEIDDKGRSLLAHSTVRRTLRNLLDRTVGCGDGTITISSQVIDSKGYRFTTEERT